eukprot:Awhi_evm1s3457
MKLIVFTALIFANIGYVFSRSLSDLSTPRGNLTASSKFHSEMTQDEKDKAWQIIDNAMKMSDEDALANGMDAARCYGKYCFQDIITRDCLECPGLHEHTVENRRRSCTACYEVVWCT